jgi:hypothetical protein
LAEFASFSARLAPGANLWEIGLQAGEALDSFAAA